MLISTLQALLILVGLFIIFIVLAALALYCEYRRRRGILRKIKGE